MSDLSKAVQALRERKLALQSANETHTANTVAMQKSSAALRAAEKSYEVARDALVEAALSQEPSNG